MELAYKQLLILLQLVRSGDNLINENNWDKRDYYSGVINQDAVRSSEEISDILIVHTLCLKISVSLKKVVFFIRKF